MNEGQVQIVRLDPMRVICFNGFGSSPEEIALQKLRDWAGAHGAQGRVFGFNNPNPAPGSPNYGYDVWMVVDETVQPEGEGQLLDFAGGLYAVARCAVHDPGKDIGAAWQALVRWAEGNGHELGSHQWLEEQITFLSAVDGEDFILDLYLPLKA
jgi:DNA gyrase inhibitor GyrI